ncbi:hypothetical protein [Mycoplasmopsis gallinacea]|uniref:Uncharacterized protein n=1 Tax=Mycoplasmopsis gallinacea TaxID=29556 RepID=A0A449A219_9BACT|nr:hypothetical protein [Mycoplasmopsis gallinacea]VEU58269.1 Uncharacterised protein [Mycoplasmopsis gallinacea]
MEEKITKNKILFNLLTPNQELKSSIENVIDKKFELILPLSKIDDEIVIGLAYKNSNCKKFSKEHILDLYTDSSLLFYKLAIDKFFIIDEKILKDNSSDFQGEKIGKNLSEYNEIKILKTLTKILNTFGQNIDIYKISLNPEYNKVKTAVFSS